MMDTAARRFVAERAKFDLGCEQVSLTRLGDVARLGQQETSLSIGAIGCDKKATYYVECASNWGQHHLQPATQFAAGGAETQAAPG